MKNRSEFAQNLIALRKEKGMSQRDLAEKSGISNRMIAYYETNSVIPPIEKLELLAQTLEVSVARLLDSELTDKEILKLNTRTLKKIKLLEQLPADDQRKVLDYIQALIDQNKLQQQLSHHHK